MTQARVLQGARVQLIRGLRHTKDEPDLSAGSGPKDATGFVPQGPRKSVTTDTKALSTIFELVSCSAAYATAKAFGYDVVEPTVQNHYPDFTYHKGLNRNGKIAIDVRTTYRLNDNDRFSC